MLVACGVLSRLLAPLLASSPPLCKLLASCALASLPAVTSVLIHESMGNMPFCCPHLGDSPRLHVPDARVFNIQAHLIAGFGHPSRGYEHARGFRNLRSDSLFSLSIVMVGIVSPPRFLNSLPFAAVDSVKLLDSSASFFGK